MNLFPITGFFGVTSALDPRLISDTYASDALNVTGSENGWLMPRRGFKKLSSGAAQSGFSASFGAFCTPGYDGSYVNQKGYTSVETVSGSTYAFHIDPTTGARTELKAGSSHVPLHASNWRWFSFGQYGYGINPDDTSPIVRYQVGTTNTLTQINTPADPTGSETYTTILPSVGLYPSGIAGYQAIDWSTANANSDVSYSGVAEASRSGTVTSATSTTLVDSSQNWFQNEFGTTFTPMTVTITSGTGSGQTKTILSNTSGTLTISGSWSVTPNSSSTYRISESGSTTNGELLVCCHTASASTGAASFTIDFSSISGLGLLDWHDRDRLQFLLWPYAISNSNFGWLSIDPTSWTFSVTTNSGTVYTPVVTRDTIGWVAPGGSTVQANVITLEFDGHSRTDWTTAKSIKASFTITGASTQGARANRLAVGRLAVGGVDMSVPAGSASRGLGLSAVKFGYSYYNSTTTLESGVNGIISIPNNKLIGTTTPYVNTSPALGANLNLIAPLSADGQVNTVRFYVQDGFGTWRRIGSAANTGTPTVEYYYSWTEVSALPAYVSSPFNYSNLVAGIPFRGWIVWLTKGGGGVSAPNVRHSGVGQPLRLYDANNDASSADATRPADFSLADNFSDAPLNAYQADDVLIITGSEGIYAQTAGSGLFANAQGGFASIGYSPSTMSPPKKLPGSKGAAGVHSSCRFHDESGNPGVAWMSQDGEIWFCVVTGQFDGSVGFRITQLSRGIQGLAKSFLLDGQPTLSLTDFSTAILGVDEASDSLWVVMGARALVLRKPSLVDGQRQWEPYWYNLNGDNHYFKSLCFSPDLRLRAALSDGRFVELEYDSGNSYAPITGTLLEDGLDMVDGYWKSKIFQDSRLNKRAVACTLVRDDLTQAVDVTVYSTNITSPSGYTATIASGARRARFPSSASGPEAQYKIKVVEGQSTIHKLVLHEVTAGERARK